MGVEVTVKKWGNSFGVVLPREIVEKEGLKENKKIVINIIKQADLSDIFGLVKNRKMSGQKMKDLSRKEWAK
ncbi:AbrB/MazE/SpoVT family DNA-binding domain-containing protein [Candidatus Pacearchaeota archaeon]|nr:AbrB/MazE/SpoVT family DNA-binding domain-containing protein [Candidatus Pacearchaeota archaeon]